ncbi:MAG: hypothetical protein IKP74_08370, partial [Clostridia bacterium]|nr:hypothetical protein [Clostridia bacterium]
SVGMRGGSVCLRGRRTRRSRRRRTRRSRSRVGGSGGVVVLLSAGRETEEAQHKTQEQCEGYCGFSHGFFLLFVYGEKCFVHSPLILFYSIKTAKATENQAKNIKSAQ